MSGTPPESMLDAKAVQRVAGDTTTGFYEPDPDTPVPGPKPGDRARKLEGYSWRGMTSGSPLQAFWVFLAPFALANTASVMRPPVDGMPKWRLVARLHAALLRLFALSLTLTMVMAAFIASVDEGGWQCGNDPACRSAHTPTKVLGWGWFANSASRRVALTLVVPLAVIGALWFFARQAWNARAAVVPSARTSVRGEAVDAATALDDPAMWNDREPSEFLRHLHVAASFNTVSAATAIGLAYMSSDQSLRVVAWFALALLLVCVVTAAIGWVGDPATATPKAKARRRYASVGALIGSVVVFAALAIVLANGRNVAETKYVSLPGVEAIIVTLFGVQLIVTFVALILGMLPITANKNHNVGLRGAGSGVVGGLSLALGAMFSAGLVLRAGDYLGQVLPPGAKPGTKVKTSLVAVPNALTWAARGALLMAILIVVMAVVGAVWFFVARRRYLHAGNYDTNPPALNAREHQVRRAEFLATLTDRTGPILLGPAIVAFLVAAGVTGIVVHIDRHHYKQPFAVVHNLWITNHAASYGSWLITAFAVAMLGVVLRARKSESLRRTVGIIWDLTTFWPRHAHPLGPPCYTDRALPEFLFRTRWHVEQGRDVILSGHSQGSIIAATAALQLCAGERERVAFLTYGSPLQRLYAPWFPAYFNAQTFTELELRLPDRWQNLHRTTDPIGGPIPLGRNDVSIDPSDVVAPGDYVFPEIRVHSDYPLEPKFDTAIGDLDRAL